VAHAIALAGAVESSGLAVGFLDAFEQRQRFGLWRACPWQQTAAPARRPPWREHALGRDAWLRTVEGWDCLDVALFHCGGVGEPRAVPCLFAGGLLPQHRAEPAAATVCGTVSDPGGA